MSSIKVRFPPSPTGFCHVGTARMALLNYLFAKKNGGTIVFRSEDTDRARSTKEYEDDIIESIKWLGLSWDEFLRQSERTSMYTAHLKRLISEDKAYESEEESKNEPGKMVKVVRLRNPGKSITFTDIVRGDITFDTTELADFIIARAIDDPLYHFTVVVDDNENGITHVIRGEEHISNTPRQILIQEALGFERPQYAHYPLFLSTDRAKLSKRKGDVAVREYRSQGFLAPALLNFIGTLGWTPPSGREILSLDEMVQEFDLSDLHKSGAVFDLEKLRWYNREYLLKMPDADFASEALAWLQKALTAKGLNWDEAMSRKILPLIKERISVWSDIDEIAEQGEFDFFFADPQLDASILPGKGNTPDVAKKHLAHVQSVLTALDADAFSAPDTLKNALWDYATTEGRGAVLWPLRFALTGKERSPDPFTVASHLGKEKTLSRLKFAADLL